MNELITRLASILNLPKAAAVTAPGIVAALAIFLISVPSSDGKDSCLRIWLFRPSDSKTCIDGKQPPAAATNAPEIKKPSAPTPSASDAKASIPEKCRIPAPIQPASETELDRRIRRNQRLGVVDQCLEELAPLIIEQDKEIGKKEAQLKTLETTAEELARNARDYAVKKSPLVGEAERRASAALGSIASAKADLKTAEAKRRA